MSQIVNLRQMQVGQQGKIAAVEALGEMNRRIRDMGLIPGTTVSIVGRAPLKDPVALRLSGVTISLRNSEADFIKVDLAGVPAASFPNLSRLSTIV
jgi:ferrous iron transport protein A